MSTDSNIYMDFDPFYPLNLAILDMYVERVENEDLRSGLSEDVYRELLDRTITEAQDLVDMMQALIERNDGFWSACSTCGGVVMISDFCAVKGRVMVGMGEPVSCPLCGDFM